MGFDIAVTILTKPTEGFKLLRDKSLLWLAVIFLIFSANARPLTMSGSILIKEGLFSIISVLYVTLIIFIFARLFNGYGTFGQTFQAIGFSYIPLVFLGPAALIEIIFSNQVGFANISSVVSFALSIWSLVLFIIGIRESHQISTGKAVFLCITPLLFPLLITLLFGIGFVLFVI